MVIAAGDLEAALKIKGFKLERLTTDKMFFFYYGGLKTDVFTKISHGRSEQLRDTLCAKVKRQMRLDTSRQLTDFVECALTAEGYIEHLKAKGVIP